MVETANLAIPEIYNEPTFKVRMELGGADLFEESGVFDHVKRLGQVDTEQAGARRRLRRVKTLGDLRHEREKRRDR